MTKKKRIMLAIAGTATAALLYVGWKLTARSAYESAAYTVVESDGACEIRDYPGLMLATTSMATESQGEDGSFMRLFGFISGRNRSEQKIAMTVPVFMEKEAGDSDASMSFVVHPNVTKDGIPEPTNELVEISRRPGGRFAVIRFSGRLNKVTTMEQERLLRKWIADRGLFCTTVAETAGYDPPWTPGPFRRNEVLIRLTDSGSKPTQ